MGSPEPIPGKCGARNKGAAGGYCTADPVQGAKRCRMHGGTSTGEHAVTHGLYSSRLRMRYADDDLKARLEELVDDPHLLNPRRTVALSQVALEGIPFCPPREQAVKMARRVLRLDPEQQVPEDAVEAAMIELAAIYGERLVVNAGTHAKTVATAAKQEKVTEILIRGAMPIMRRFAQRVAGLVKTYLPPVKQAEFLAGLARIIEETQLEIVRFGAEADGLVGKD